MKIPKSALPVFNVLVILFIVAHVFLYVRNAIGVTSTVNLRAEGTSFVQAIPGANGSGSPLPTGTSEYYVVVGYNGSPTPSPIVKSAPTTCKLGTGQNSCTINWPCIAGASTYRLFYNTATSSLDDGDTASYKSVSAPTVTYEHVTTAGDSTDTIPSGSLPIANVAPRGDESVNTLVCKTGIGKYPSTPTPAAVLELGGSIQLDNSGKIRNGATPSGILDYATKSYTDNVCYFKLNPPSLHFKLDEATGTSTSGFGLGQRNGTLTNSPSWTSPTFNGSSGIDFGSGTSTQYIAISSLPIGTTWTIVGWTLFPLPTNTYKTMVRGSTDHQVLVDTNGLLGMYDNAGATGFHSSGYDVDVLAAGWHMVAAVGSGTTTTFYIDGASVGSSNLKTTDPIVTIGNISSGGQPWGPIDQFVVYTKALSAGAIQNLYNNDGPI